MMSSRDEMFAAYQNLWEDPRDQRDVFFRYFGDFVADRIPPVASGRALDLGSGKGSVLKALLDRGYTTTALELNPIFVDDLTKRFPTVEVLLGSALGDLPNEEFDLVTGIHLLQNLSPEECQSLFAHLWPVAARIHINISNRRSVHGRWVHLRGFQASYVHQHDPVAVESWLRSAGYEVMFRRGLGLVTPITLAKEFRYPIFPEFVSRWSWRFDRLMPKHCHVYYIEARRI